MGSVTTKKHANGLDYVEVNTALCQARIFLQGAQIDYFQPVGKPPLLWVSSADDYQPGNGIRGGVPVCWPWFGMSSEANFPQHGFARTRIWALGSVEMRNQLVDLRFSLKISEQDKIYWPHNTEVSVLFTLGDTLSISLVNTNLGTDPVTLTQALHSYFPIEDIHQLKASGFSGSKYIEFAQGPYPQTTDEVLFDRETDRVYTDLGPVQLLHTPQGTIEVSRENSQSAVLWNPWIEKSQRLGRFNPEDYLTMVCLEAANVLEDKVVLAPGETHSLVTHICWKD
ncbi:D-hexose-6-phosphate mutarotase [Shewanella oncorhynchi]|uniref:D-hexose-6-phosphate mutarotase n=2 Tax=Shewanellaceae TaxID=267890 RepID=UPI0015632086|nr:MULTISPECIES: D-hexose-6-phosphate mutarotase [unclassified Shewanella]MCU7984637.1 D-hexose-6-phosphate mutarotase [Shewanella sp. SW24]MCU8023822.1 D-hexose-6-phosphate mutarotase [Shewanella sp. SM78]MCU8070211.1 D-hexose-6-phosphate mutarotase [Shewanella sp. SM32]MCU8080862.1 D-hexose-6-phosphate mutarotase [Shewanella sp. SM103]NRD32388.1 D-hexose-6-phosphate mutarotase [Shewanella sp. DC2-4]